MLDAIRDKLRKMVKVGATLQYEQDYLGGLEYRKVGTNAKRLEAVYHDEGRYYNLNVEVSNTVSIRREYSLRDHLGNTRLTFTDRNANGIVDITNNPTTSDILQENHCYPFGMNYEGPWLMNDAARDTKYQYNGKEMNDDFGLNWMDYGMRWYDAAIGRWGQIDPQASKYFSLSPYNYVANNPIINIDPRGDTLRGVNKQSAGRALSIIKSGFKESSVSSLFKLSKDGRTFSSISRKDIAAVRKSGASKYEKALFEGYARLVNGKETNVVEVVKRGETLSSYGQNTAYKDDGVKTANDVDSEYKGGRKVQATYQPGVVNVGAEGAYSAIVMNSEAAVSGYSDNAKHASLPGELMAHEFLGHFLGGRAAQTDAEEYDASIQSGNLYLQATGKSYYRMSHMLQHTKSFNPKAIPKYLLPH